MTKRRLMVYLDPGFLENRGHYMNFSKHIHAEAARRGIAIRHYVNSATSKDYCAEHGLIAEFGRTAYLADSTKNDEVVAIVDAIDQGFARIVASIAAEAGNFDEIVYYMYTGHPAYLSSLALQLARHPHGAAAVAAHVVLFYLSDRFSYGSDDGRYASYLQRVSRQLDHLDPDGKIHVGIDSDTAQASHAAQFSRSVTVVPFPHMQRAEMPAFPAKQSTKSCRPRITYTGYPHSKYGFHLVLALLERSLNFPFWANVEFELKLNARLKEDDLVQRWESLKGKLKNLHVHEGYMEDADYLAMIGRADVLLVPYGSQYNHDTSAVLVDGLLSGSVIVAAEPTWMANVFSQHGSGQAYVAEDPDSFIAATLEVVANLADYRKRTTRNIAGVPWKFSAEGLFDMLFPRWRAALPAAAHAAAAIAPGSGDDKVMLPPVMVGSNASRENELSQEQLMQELANLKKQLKGLNPDFLPGDKIPLPQRVADLRAIADAWGGRERHQARFEALAAGRKASRCVMIGPDVSLDPETIKALRDEVVFAPQQTYRQFRGTATTPTYLILESVGFIQNNLDDIRKLGGMEKFAPFHAAHLFAGDATVRFFNHQPRKSYPDGYDVSLRAQDITYTSCTVVGTALQIAMSMGFGEVCLLGVDVGAGSAERAELEKFYAEAARTAGKAGIRLVNVCLDTIVPHVAFAAIEPFATTQRRARAVLDAAFSGKFEKDWSAEELAIAERVLLNKHPCPSDIYLPTSKYNGLERVSAIRKVVTAWNDRQEIHKARLRDAKQRMRGRKRCFIIGNGPSLNQTNLDLLADEVTFATNGIFLKFGDTKFRPTFYVVEDHLVGEDRYREINELAGFVKMSPYYLAYCLEDGDETIYYNHRGRKSYPHGFDFSTNAEEITYTGCTVTFSCMQLAYYMGFKEIYLIGVDMSYTIPEEVKKANEYDTEILDMEIDDPNHFVPNYFGRGYRWHDPNVDKMEQAYIEARKVTEQNGVKIFNATVGGKCEVFDRVDYYTLFGKRGQQARIPATTVVATQVTPQKKLATLYSMPAGKSVLAVVNQTLDCRHPLAIDLSVSRAHPTYLVLETTVHDPALFDGLRVEVDGVLVTHSLHFEQDPGLIKAILSTRDGETPTRVRLLLEAGLLNTNTHIYLASITILPEKSFLNAPFPLSHFDGVRYLKENQDVARAVSERLVISALAHYVSQGRQEGRKFVLASSHRPNPGYRYESHAA